MVCIPVRFFVFSIWNGIPLGIQALWTTVILLIALAIALLMLIRRKVVAYSSVVVWVSVGIATKRAAFPIVYGTAFPVIEAIITTIILFPIRV